MMDENNVFVINLDMANRAVEDIARDAAMKIVEITDEMIDKQKLTKTKKTEDDNSK